MSSPTDVPSVQGLTHAVHVTCFLLSKDLHVPEGQAQVGHEYT